MNNKLAILILCLTAFVIPATAQSVVITGKKVEYKRPKPESEYKATFEINYPKVKASTPALSKRIEQALSYERAFPYFKLKDEMTESQWLQSADFEVGYNKNGVLAVALSMEGSGAYPSGDTKYVIVDLKTGTAVKPTDTFTNIPTLLKLVRQAKTRDVAKARGELKNDSGADLEGFDYAIKESSQYHPVKLDQFSISDKGITFHHDYGFAHVIQALQPDGEFFFSWAQVRPYLKAGGVLAKAAR